MSNTHFTRNIFFFGLLSLVLGFQSCSNKQETTSLILPKDPGLVAYGNTMETDKHKERLQYIDQLHKAHPNVDWRRVELENSRSKYQNSLKYNKKRSRAYASYVGGQVEAKWLEKGSSNQSGRTMVSAYDTATKEIFVVSAGGTIFKGSKNGKNWIPLNDQLQMQGASYIGIDYLSGSRTIWVASSKYLYYSNDEGLTWNTSTGLESVIDWGSIQRVIRTNNAAQSFVAITQEWDYVNWNAAIGVYIANAAGTDFQRIESRALSTNQMDAWAPMDADTNAYVILSNELYKVDYANAALQSVGTLPINPNKVLITGAANATTHRIYTYTDGDIYSSADTGVTWNQQGSLTENPFRRTSFYALSDDPNTVLFGGVNAYISSDGGQNFQQINHWGDYYSDVKNKLHADIPSILSVRDESGTEVIHFNTDGGLYNSLNGTTVKNLSMHGLNVSQYYSVYTFESDTNTIYSGAQDQGFQQSYNDSGNAIAFDQLVSGDYAHIVSANDGYSIWHEYPGFIVYKEDPSSDPWTATANFDGRGDLWLPPLSAYSGNPSMCYMGGKSSTGTCLYRVENQTSGIVYQEMPYYFSLQGGGTVTAVENSSVDENLLFVNADDKFFISRDRGVSYTSSLIPLPPQGHYFHGSTIYASSQDVGIVYIGGSGYSNPGVFVSSDTGKTFTEITNGLPNTLVFDLAGSADDSIIYAATEAGAFAFSIVDSTWHEIGQGIAPDQAYWSVEWVDTIHTVRYGTYGRGIWDFKIKNDSTPNDSVGDSNVVVIELGEEQTLGHVWPNPVQNHLYMSMGGDDIESVDVYSLNGQLIVSKSNPGSSIDLNRLETGSYLIRMKSAEKQVIKKFLKINSTH